MSDTVAVIVPVHNGAAYLTDCLRAIAGQTHRNLLCFVVDDGSTDATPALCDEFAASDPRFTVLHQPCRGVSEARAAGVRAAARVNVGWFAFCDADDLYHPTFLESLLRAAVSTGLPLACCRYEAFSAGTPENATPPAEIKTLNAPAHADALLHSHAVDYALWNKLYRADLMDAALIANGYTYNEDLYANWLLFGRAPGLALVPFAGYHYRQHPESATHRPLKPQSIDEQRRVALYIREHAAPALQESANAFYYEKLVYLASMILRRDDAPDFCTQFSELSVAIAAGLRDGRLGRNPRLPLSIKCAAWATVKIPGLWQRVCRTLLKDRQ